MVKVFVSNSAGYFKEKEIKKSNSLVPDIIVDDSIEYQKNKGFGGAFTDSCASLYNKMSEELKEEFISALYSKNGLNYSLMRITIGSCDFSTELYDYLEEGSFSLAHDDKVIIPFIKKIKAIKDLKLFASPWSPPAIYKTNGIRQYGGALKDNCYLDYANYLVNYLKEMKKRGLNVDYMSLQNEPQATQTWDSCIYTPDEEAKLLAYVYDLIEENGLNTKLYIWDHNRDVILNRVKETLTFKVIDKAAGIAYHWYDSGCSKELSKVHEIFKDKDLFFTEGCIELLNLDRNNPQAFIGHFENGLRYCRNYILDSENFSNAFIDWNMVLDTNGGPNYVGNFCEAPIIFDEANNKLIYNPSYYVISHFSRFIEKNDVRVDSKVYCANVLVTTYKKQDGSLIMVILNDGIEKEVRIHAKEEFMVVLPQKSITTIIIK